MLTIAQIKALTKDHGEYWNHSDSEREAYERALSRVLLEHGRWLRSDGKSGFRLELTGELQGMLFTGAKLDGSRFDGCEMRHVDIAHPELEGTLIWPASALDSVNQPREALGEEALSGGHASRIRAKRSKRAADLSSPSPTN